MLFWRKIKYVLKIFILFGNVKGKNLKYDKSCFPYYIHILTHYHLALKYGNSYTKKVFKTIVLFYLSNGTNW